MTLLTSFKRLKLISMSFTSDHICRCLYKNQLKQIHHNPLIKSQCNNYYHSKRYILDHSTKQWRVLFLGAPGVGKGTYSKAIAKKFPQHFQLVTSGDLIRQAAKSNHIINDY